MDDRSPKTQTHQEGTAEGGADPSVGTRHHFGNRGRLKGKTLEEITSSGNCTTLIMAAIIYWQAKEISRIVEEHNPDEAGIDLSLLAHISPIEWSNVILYGEYKLNKELVRC